ncbi:hypothetical protein [Shouchella lonarensis]|uniref:Uncharacterized protein n=1 Tax=Shouchella lonarensis TaxID=1464122 RepID=A0A1G6HEH4_9BACI|nr:hypothetical protein [Shouchella lonarensis]SDB92508.1 hypothetical protein SAMN05421737_103234 [Shouchella lonarensis]
MKKKRQQRFLVYTVAILAVALVTFLAIWQETWYRLAVLGALVFVGVIVMLLLVKMRKFDAYIKDAPQRLSVDKTLPAEAIDFEKIEEKERKLKALDSEKTQIFEELLSKTKIEEREKIRLREKMVRADEETSRIRTEWLKTSERFSSLVHGTKRWLSRDGVMSEVASSIDPVVLREGTIAELNREIGRVVPSLSKETIHGMKSAGYVDEMYQLTRAGYKALKQDKKSQAHK